MVVMNWLGKMIGLPEEFLHRKGGNGGGVIQVNEIQLRFHYTSNINALFFFLDHSK